MTNITTGKATDFITFSRASLATVTDSDGRIKWAPHNLLTNSESFDAAAWTKNNVTVAANTIVAPNGTMTADTSTSTGNLSYLVQGYSGSGTFTCGVFAKAGTNSAITIRISGAGNGYQLAFTLSGSGTVGSASIAGTGGSISNMTGVISALADGWYYCAITFSDTGGSNFVHLYQTATSGTIHLWGAHLYRSDLGGMVANTSAYPMYNPTTPKNLLGFTEDFSNGYWGKSQTTVTANSIIAPNGLQTADQIIEDTTTGGHGISAASITVPSGTNYVWSVYAKSAGRNWVFINAFDGSNRRCWFNLASGVTGTVAAGCTATITSVGDNWYRLSVSRVAGSATVSFSVNMSTSDNSTSYTGDGTSGVYLWGAQLSDSASLDPYVANAFAAPTAAAYNGPRLDYSGSSLSALGLLVEEQRTNLLLRSQEFDNASWTKVAATVTANAGVAPDGTSTAEKVVESATTAVHYILQIATTTAASHTFSTYAKAGERSLIILQCDNPSVSQQFNLSTGALGNATGSPTSTITPVGNGWYRCTMTFAAISTTPAFYIILATGSGSNYAGDGTSGVFVYGAQLEAGAFATSYIPTGASTVTRSADVASVATSAFPYSASEGSLVFSGAIRGSQGASTVSFVQLSNGVSNGVAMHIGMFDVTAPLFAVSDGTSQASLDLGSMSVGQVVKIAGAYRVNDFAGVINGGTVETDTSGSVPTGITRMGIGERLGGVYINGWIRQITYIPRRLSNSELQARTL